MRGADLISKSLEFLAEARGDPTDEIYALLFERHPHFEAMFVLDTDGGVRGSMLTASFDCILGVAEGSEMPRRLLEAARTDHEGYGLNALDIDEMFVTIRDVTRTSMGPKWSDAYDAAWTILLSELRSIGATVDT